MREDEKIAMLWGLLVGTFLMVLVVVFAVESFKREAIKYNAARYNETSGKFEWIGTEEVTE